jgi:hypothetical protein
MLRSVEISSDNLKTERVGHTLVQRQPAPKLKPSEVSYVSSLVRYLRNPKNATLLEAFEVDSVTEVAEYNTET